jgi:hypothetical protein
MSLTMSNTMNRRSIWASLGALLAMVVLGTSGLMLAAASRPPEPDPVPRRWQLDVEIGPVRVLTLKDREGNSKGYLYLTYTVVNNSKEDVPFYPRFDASFGGEGAPVRSGRDVPLEITRQVRESTQNPDVQDQIAILGQLLRGRENSKVGLVVWPLVDANASEISIYWSGFSGETTVFEKPDSKEKVTLRKTLMTRYVVPGTLVKQGSTPLVEFERRWIMR